MAQTTIIHRQYHRRIPSQGLSFLLALLLLAGCGRGGAGGQDTPQPVGGSVTGQSVSSQPSSNPAPVEATPEASNFVAADLRLEWNIPAAREDGTPLAMAEIAGYEISYINSAQQLRVINIDDGMTTSHIIRDLAPDDYEIAVFVYDINNALSEASSPLILRRDNFPTR